MLGDIEHLIKRCTVRVLNCTLNRVRHIKETLANHSVLGFIEFPKSYYSILCATLLCIHLKLLLGTCGDVSPAGRGDTCEDIHFFAQIILIEQFLQVIRFRSPDSTSFVNAMTHSALGPLALR